MATKEGPFMRIRQIAGRTVKLDGTVEIGTFGVGEAQSCDPNEDTCPDFSTTEAVKWQLLFEPGFFTDVIAYDRGECKEKTDRFGQPLVIDTFDAGGEERRIDGPFTRLERGVSIDRNVIGSGVCDSNNGRRLLLDYFAQSHAGYCCNSGFLNVAYYPDPENADKNTFGERSGSVEIPIRIDFTQFSATEMNGVWELVEIIRYGQTLFRLEIYESLWEKTDKPETVLPEI